MKCLWESFGERMVSEARQLVYFEFWDKYVYVILEYLTYTVISTDVKYITLINHFDIVFCVFVFHGP